MAPLSLRERKGPIASIAKACFRDPRQAKLSFAESGQWEGEGARAAPGNARIETPHPPAARVPPSPAPSTRAQEGEGMFGVAHHLTTSRGTPPCMTARS